MRLLFLGENDDGISVSSHHAGALAKKGWQAAFASPDGDALDPASCDAVHLVTGAQRDARLVQRIGQAREAGLPVIRFWTGGDLLWAKYHEASRRIATAFDEAGVQQLCRTEDARAQLQELGIDATVFPILSLHVSSTTPPQPLPQQFTVLCHLPVDRRDFYGGELVDCLVRWLPRVRFLLLGATRRSVPDAKNVEPLGRVEDVARSIQRATTIVHARLDESPSRLMLEALALGRHVVANCPWPNCTLAHSVDEFVVALRTLQREVSFNLTGREDVCRTNDVLVTSEALHQLFQSVAEKGRSPMKNGIRSTLASLPEQLDFSPPDLHLLPPDAHAFRALIARSNAHSLAASA